jgi:hypothetical protein
MSVIESLARKKTMLEDRKFTVEIVNFETRSRHRKRMKLFSYREAEFEIVETAMQKMYAAFAV